MTIESFYGSTSGPVLVLVLTLHIQQSRLASSGNVFIAISGDGAPPWKGRGKGKYTCHFVGGEVLNLAFEDMTAFSNRLIHCIWPGKKKATAAQVQLMLLVIVVVTYAYNDHGCTRSSRSSSIISTSKRRSRSMCNNYLPAVKY